MQIKKIVFILFFFKLVYAIKIDTVELGRDYTMINNRNIPQISTQNKQVNIKEFFSFYCIHCKDVEPLVEAQLLNNKNIKLERIHVIVGDGLNNLGKVAATINALKLPKLNMIFFEAIGNGNEIKNNKDVQDILKGSGVKDKDIIKFMNYYNSFAIDVTVGEYKQLTKAFDIKSTPVFIVNNKYLVLPAKPDKLIAVVKFLVNKEMRLNGKY